MKKTLLILLSFMLPLLGNSVLSWRSLVETPNISKKSPLFKTSETPYLYLNTLRTATGLNAFIFNDYLELSSQNHTLYITSNNIVGHTQSNAYSNFTGITPTDRAYYVGYNSSISENLSAGQEDFYESIDDLMGAIYHRFGFLDFTKDSIGIGFSQSNSLTAFVFNMGNSSIENLCLSESFSGFGSYYMPCKDTNKKIEVTTYTNALKIENPSYVVWPYKNYNEAPPVFYEESPDPLPNQSVSGYPVSIQFNEISYPSGVALNSFELFNDNDELISDVLMMDSNNDVNGKFSEYEFALFPLKRLDWGKVYHSKVVFTNKANNQTQTIQWSFKTRALEYDYFILTQANENIELIPNKNYVLYLQPLNDNEWSNGYSISYEGGVSTQIEYLDLNTLLVNFSGTENQTATFFLNNGREVHITLKAQDSAISYLTQDENLQTIIDPVVDTFDYNVENLSQGWHLLGAIENIDDMSIFDGVDIIWVYQNNTWYVYSHNSDIQETILNSSFKDYILQNIEQGKGFWVKK